MPAAPGSFLVLTHTLANLPLPVRPARRNRPENIPGLVFEEVTVKSVGVTVDGPLGPIQGAILVDELHMDGGHEDKTFAPDYGEFYTAAEGDVEALALAIPTDAASGPAPAELSALSGGALGFIDGPASIDWATAVDALTNMTSAWDAYRATGVPVLIEPRLDDALAALSAAIEARDPAATRQAAIDVARSAFDLQLRYRAVPEMDLARFDLWAAQLQIDAAAGQEAAVNGDLFSLDYVRDRIIHGLSVDDAAAINLSLEELTIAVGDTDLDAASEVAGQLREVVAASEIAAN